MPPLADWVPDIDEITSAIWRRVAADATLQTLLGGAGHVVGGKDAPPAAGAKRLHIIPVFWDLDQDVLTGRFIYELRAVAPNLNKGTAVDREALGDLIQRATALITIEHGDPGFSASGYQFHDSWPEGGFGPEPDPEVSGVGYQAQRFTLRARKI